MHKILLLSMVILISCTGSNTTKEVTGIINIRGHEPFSYLSIETIDDKIYEIEISDSLKNELWELQGLKVRLDVQEFKINKNFNRDVIVVTNYLVAPISEMEKGDE